MIDDSQIPQALYKKLLTFYPQGFREQLAGSMEQTFNDLCKEKRQARKGVFRFVIWAFVETTMGILREHLWLITKGDIMQTALATLGFSGGISFLLMLPLLIMELVNRRQFNEDFPFALFFGMWLNLFAVSLILLPLVRARWVVNRDTADPVSVQGNTLLTNPRSALMISLVLVLFIVILAVLASFRWEPLERLINGPNPEVAYPPGRMIALLLISFPIAAGIIAGGPIVHTLRSGGSLFAHPLHLIVLLLILSTFVIGFTSLLIDQWPCFIGVPVCD